MVKAQKRLTKREKKEDKFVTFYFQAQDFVKKYSSKIISGAVGVTVVFSLFMFLRSQSAGKEEEAVAILLQARLEHLEGDLEAAVPMFQSLIDTYGGTSTAKSANFHLANVFFEQGNYTYAEQHFLLYIENGADDILKTSSVAGIAACYEQQKKYEEAGRKYEEAANRYGVNFMEPSHLIGAARCYKLAGLEQEATRVLKKFLKRHEKSDLRESAELLLAELSS